MRNFAFFLLLPFLCAASDAPPSVDSVVELARSVPGEFAADALIRVAGLTSIDKARRIQLLEMAFQRAAEAQEPLKKQPAITRIPGAANFLNRAFNQDLDRLSLELRAVEAMEPLDGEKARALLRKIQPPRIPKLQCADFMVYNVSRYYDVLGRWAQPRQIRDAVGAITSPVQVPSAARIIGGAPNTSDFQEQLKAFAGALGKISGDDRAFTFTRDPGRQIFGLVEECKRRKLSPLPLLEAYRLYLVNNEQAPRCADDELMEDAAQQSFVLATGTPAIGGEGVEYFNKNLRIAPLQPIQEQETTPTRLEGVAEGLRGCQETSCQAITGQYTELIFAPETRTAYPPSYKNTPEWHERLTRFLAALDEWKQGSAATAAQYYRQKSALYADTLSLVPPGPLQKEVVQGMLTYEEKSEFETANHIEWFLPLNILAGRMAMDPLGIGKLDGMLRESRNPVIHLYGELEKVAPRRPDQIMSLL